MLRRFTRKLRRTNAKRPATEAAPPPRTKSQSLSPDLATNLSIIRKRLGESMDLKVRELYADDGRMLAAVIHLEGMVDDQVVYNQILKTLTFEMRLAGEAPTPREETFRRLQNQFISVTEVRQDDELDRILFDIVSGDTVVLVDTVPKGLVCGARGWEGRRVEEPQNETVVRGPREGFTETLKTNISLVRRRIMDPQLRVKPLNLGSRSRTAIAVVYIEGITKPELVQEVCTRLERIELDGVLETGYIEEFIEDSPWSPFPQSAQTERPDTVAAALLEGRVAIMVDGTPFVILVPVVFWQMLVSAEDYYERWVFSSAIRFLRVTMFGLSLVLPSLYVAITTFHQELLPTPLVLSIAAQREGVPFPAFVEAVGMEIAFEMLREAGLRLPRAVGQAVSIVGALVIGEAAVNAGLVSPAMVIVVAATGIASFSAPGYNLAISARLLRFPMLFGAATLGLFGVSIVIAVVLVHLASLRSFGVPYLAPLSPFNGADLKDVFIRVPWWAMWTRPRPTGARNTFRQVMNATNQTPEERRPQNEKRGARPE